MTKQLQQRNAQNVDLLRPEFQHRSEPNYAWSRVISMYMALPALRGLWPMSSTLWLAGNQGVDISGCTNYLTNNNTALFGYDSLAPYIEFDGVNQHLSRPDLGAANWADITGTEAYIVAAQRGLTFGCWAYTDSVAAGSAGLITKYNTAGNQRSYMLRRSAATAQLFISTNGIAGLGPAQLSISANEWFFCVGRYIPDAANAELKLWINDVTDIVNIGASATIFDSTTNFEVGWYIPAGGAGYWNGKVSMAFLCAAQLSDAIVLSLYEQTRAMYGV